MVYMYICVCVLIHHVLHILDMLDILRIYMRIYCVHHRISGVCSEHGCMCIYVCWFTHVLQHAGYARYTAYIHAYILRIFCAYLVHVLNMPKHMFCTSWISLHILRIYMRIYCVHTAYIGGCYEHIHMHVIRHPGYASIYCVYTCVYTTYIIAYRRMSPNI